MNVINMNFLVFHLDRVNVFLYYMFSKIIVVFIFH